MFPTETTETIVVTPLADFHSSERVAIELVGGSAAAACVRELVRRAASVDTGALLVGEAGTEGETVARELHARSRPAGAPFVEIECGAHEAAWFDIELFGHVTGEVPADLESITPDSRLAQARGGTLFLSGVGELSASAQGKLARVARDREVRIDGMPVSTDLRIVASALPTIDTDVRENRFRPDLYRRLAASRINLPALRHRAADVTELAVRLLEETAAPGRPAPAFTKVALALLSALAWPGNVGQLRAVVERAAADCGGGPIQVEHVLPALNLDAARAASTPAGSLREARNRFERDYIATVLQHHGWKMADAAQTLGIQRPNLYRKARQLGIPVARVVE